MWPSALQMPVEKTVLQTTGCQLPLRARSPCLPDLQLHLFPVQTCVTFGLLRQ